MIRHAFLAGLVLAATAFASARAGEPVSGSACPQRGLADVAIECESNYSFKKTFTCLPGPRSGYLMWVVTGLSEGPACVKAPPPAPPKTPVCALGCVDGGFYNGYLHCYSYVCPGQQGNPRCMIMARPPNQCPARR
jgi:hypothetical protein